MVLLAKFFETGHLQSSQDKTGTYANDMARSNGLVAVGQGYASELRSFFKRKFF